MVRLVRDAETAQFSWKQSGSQEQATIASLVGLVRQRAAALPSAMSGAKRTKVAEGASVSPARVPARCRGSARVVCVLVRASERSSNLGRRGPVRGA